MASDLDERIAKIAEWPKRPLYFEHGYEEANYESLRAAAALARLALVREWIDGAHQNDCSYDGSYEGGECSCGRDALLKAMEVPRG
jgi:hypothetical protein